MFQKTSGSIKVTAAVKSSNFDVIWLVAHYFYNHIISGIVAIADVIIAVKPPYVVTSIDFNSKPPIINNLELE